MKEKILEMLRASKHYRSGEEISSILHISRSAVWKHIRQLREEGHHIEAVSSKGYLLHAEADVLSEQALWDALGRSGLTGWIKKIDYAPQADSTNQMARVAAGAGAPDHTIFMTAHQQAGRGRRGRSWLTEADLNLTFSLLLRPSITPRDLAPLTLYTGLCVALALNACLNKNVASYRSDQAQTSTKMVGIKWPNDLVATASGKKIGGVLLESMLEENRVDALIMGIGVNLNSKAFPDDLQASATSVLLETEQSIRRLDVLCQILQTLQQYEKHMLNRPFWLSEYRKLCLTLNRPVRVITASGLEQHGQALDIDQDGELVILNELGKKQTVRSGEVSVRGLLGYL